MQNDPLIGTTINGYKIANFVTQTCYSRIFLCDSPKENPICIKVVSKSENQIKENKSYDQIFMTEASSLFILDHANLIKVHDVAFDKENYMIFMDFYKDGSLAHLLHRTPSMNEQIVKTIFCTLCEAVQYIHSRNISHRNICPSNILLSPKQIVLSDFGLSSLETRINSQSLNIAYMAPEVFGDDEYDEKAADIWSLGIVLYEMIAGKIPYCNFNTAIELIHQIKKGSISFSPRIPQIARNLIVKMLDMNPHTRIGIQAVFANPYLFQTRKSMAHKCDKTFNLIINQKVAKSKCKMLVMTTVEGRTMGKKAISYNSNKLHKSFG